MPNVLHYHCSVRTDYPVPSNILAPGAHEVVVTVAYVAINPVDWKMLSGNLPGAKGDHPCPFARLQLSRV